jgi:hypothetical protein
MTLAFFSPRDHCSMASVSREDTPRALTYSCRLRSCARLRAATASSLRYQRSIAAVPSASMPK